MTLSLRIRGVPEYVHKDDVKEGDILIADGGFTCISRGTELTVMKNDEGGLYVPCRQKGHHLDGQLGDDGRYIGFTKKT